jgi:hypothetical protein
LVEAGRIEAEPVESTPLEDWECVARMIASFLHTWDISGDPKWRRDHRIFERDGWRCRGPGCSSRRNLQVHHVIFRSHGGGNEDDNLAVLCATHHLQGIHAGRLRCRGSCEGNLLWEFGAGHGGAPIMTTVEEVIQGSADDCEDSSRENLEHADAASRFNVSGSACGPTRIETSGSGQDARDRFWATSGE